MSGNALFPPESTQVISGAENVLKVALQGVSLIKETYDLCGDRNGPSILVSCEPLFKKITELRERGVRIRLIAEITKENISDCKKMMQVSEVRHLDGLKGYLSICDGKLFNSHAYRTDDPEAPFGLPHLVSSTVKTLVQQQQYFFETLWKKAIPAKQRFKEIEEGARREFVETIRDPHEIQKIGFELVKRAEEEVVILFSTANAFYRQVKTGALELLKEAATLRGVKVRILVPMGNNDDAVSERIHQIKNVGIDIRTIKQTFQNKLTTLVVDQSLCLTVELKDDTKETSDEAIGLATYSNSESTVFSYVSIFENLWIQTQMHKRRRQQQEEEAAAS
jgi:two-component system, OmpR family, sensor histidine kinase VicK